MKIVNKKLSIKIVLVMALLSVLFIFNKIPDGFDLTLSDYINKLSGERTPDSSIVIIHINSDDIEQLGPWPLKRSYYALLIHNLTKYGVKKIGLEVFLSAKFVSQAIYDNVLQKEIEKANNVVLSSMAGSLKLSNDDFITDSLSYPSPKLINEFVSSGHINFISNRGILIPLRISHQTEKEKAFSLSLINDSTTYPPKIRVNFISSWKKFKTYSLVEFLQLVQANDNELLQLKNKTVLIGISDSQLASKLETNFDNQLPGIALHAFALDNLLNNRYFKDVYYNWSKYVFVVIALLLIMFLKNKKQIFLVYALALLVTFLFAFICNRYLFLDIAYSFILLPILVMFLTDFYSNLLEKRNLLTGYYNEAELLKNLLAEKEKSLSSLQKQLDHSSKKDNALLSEKIEELKEYIEKLKENKDDQNAAIALEIKQEENFFGLVFKSNQMKSIVELIKKAAPTDASILITGESGTGKELAARAIHSLSNRINNKFIAVNCAALTESLLESELFGHVKGAFTGAIAHKTGKFEAADKGTIFLDEIGETSENFQVKLLRVLQSGEYDKVGSVKAEIADVRVISATNKDLKQLLKEKLFREDLFYRLNVININLPSLRERKEDIESIARYFCNSNQKKYQLSKAVVNALKDYDWPGNVRELESAIKRAAVFCDSSGRNLIQLNDLPDEIVKNVKLNFEDIVIESLRNKKFSHTAINEIAKEIGNVSRTLVAENFRGLSLKILVKNNFDLMKTILAIANNNDEEVISRVKSKLDTWLSNIRKDVELHKTLSFDELKIQLNSKYKNLPQKYHDYLDEVIKNFLL